MLLNNRFFFCVSNSFSINSISSSVYNLLCLFLLSLFILFRVPYVYGIYFFITSLFFIIMPLFISLFLNRLEGGVNNFSASFIPVGSPVWIAPLVSLAEGISYIIRPFVLIARPFLNITIGIMGSSVLGMAVISNKLILLFLVFVFFYEVFVAFIHWFIVFSILSFSKDH